MLRSKYAPSQIIKAFPSTLQEGAKSAFPTIEMCGEIESPTLGTMSDAYPEYTDRETGETIEDMAVVWMKAQLISVCTFVGVQEKLNDWQMRSLCHQIVAENPDVTLIEFILFCSRLRSRDYEDFYGSVDPSGVLKSFNKFLEDRSEDYENRRLALKKQKEEQENERMKEHHPLSASEFRRMLKEGKFPNILKFAKTSASVKKILESASRD